MIWTEKNFIRERKKGKERKSKKGERDLMGDTQEQTSETRITGFKYQL